MISGIVLIFGFLCRYCNSRVVKFNAAGEYQGQFGDDDFYTPHSVALAEELDMICVADRDNRRSV